MKIIFVVLNVILGVFISGLLAYADALSGWGDGSTSPHPPTFIFFIPPVSILLACISVYILNPKVALMLAAPYFIFMSYIFLSGLYMVFSAIAETGSVMPIFGLLIFNLIPAGFMIFLFKILHTQPIFQNLK